MTGTTTRWEQRMGDQVERRSAEQTEEIPEIRPWREAGWMFCDGDARTIERYVGRQDE